MMSESTSTYDFLLLVIPPAALVLFFIGGFVIYLFRTKFLGAADTEMRSRGASPILGVFIRDFFAWLMSPLLRLLLAGRISANGVTWLALVLALGAGLAVGLGHFALGGWLFLGSGFCDFLDGRVARVSRVSSKSGALLDSVFDRYAEGAVFMGLAWFYRESWVLLVVLGASLGSQLVSYVRSRCSDLGVDVSRVGLFQRPERITILGTAMCLSPIVEYFTRTNELAGHSYSLTTTGLVIVAAMANLSALQRLVSGMHNLGDGKPRSATLPLRTTQRIAR